MRKLKSPDLNWAGKSKRESPIIEKQSPARIALV
jgi:hypothetical protein